MALLQVQGLDLLALLGGERRMVSDVHRGDAI